MLNRNIQPEIKPIERIEFVQPKRFEITKNCQLICFDDINNETAKLELYFAAGSVNGKPELASFTNGMLLTGTETKSSKEIHLSIDNLGGFIEQGVSNENAVLGIYSLRENLPAIAKIFKDAIENCAFLEKEIEQMAGERKQKLAVNMEKVSILAQRQFRQNLFNDAEAYGRVTNKEDIENITRQDLMEFHKQHYLKGLQRIVVVGRFSQDELDGLMDLFGSWACTIEQPIAEDFTNIKGYHHVERPDALQTAIRVGRKLFNKRHEDYLDFLILNTILGDYFGSRLMTNIREEKGYTYGIGSMVGEFLKTGYFLIGTEVKKEVRKETLAEIKIEFDRLRKKLVDEEELELVKNYMLGQLLKSADGAHMMMDLYLSVEMLGLDLDFYNKAIDAIQNITAERLQELADKYLNWDDFTIVSVG